MSEYLQATMATIQDGDDVQLFRIGWEHTGRNADLGTDKYYLLRDVLYAVLQRGSFSELHRDLLRALLLEHLQKAILKAQTSPSGDE